MKNFRCEWLILDKVLGIELVESLQCPIISKSSFVFGDLLPC